MNRLLTLIFTLALGFQSHAAVHPDELTLDESTEQVQLTSADLHRSAIYKFKKRMSFTPKNMVINGIPYTNPSQEILGFNAGEPVAVRYSDNGEDVTLSLLLAEEEAGLVPEEITVSREDFELADMQFDANGGYAELTQNYSPYEEIKEASNGRSTKRARLHWGGASGCLAYVLRALGMNRPGTIGGGRNMTSFLKNKHGWRKVSCTNPKAGDVASWPNSRGHAAIWQGGWCYDLNCSPPGAAYGTPNCARRAGR